MVSEITGIQTENEESIMVRNVDLARERLMRRGGELANVLHGQALSHRERAQRLNYALSGLNAAHAELRDAMTDLASFDCQAPDAA